MSKPVRICLVGATGLIGSALIAACVGRRDVKLVAVSRREANLPKGARMEVLLAPVEGWADAIAAANPDVMVIALGTTWAKSGKDEAAFRAVDEKLVLDCARWGLAAGAKHLIAVSSVGANRHAKGLYLRVKGEMEEALGKLGYPRLDVLRPGLIIGPRKERRILESAAQVLSPVADLFLRGTHTKYRAIQSEVLAQTIIALTQQKVRGRFTYEHEAFFRAIRRVVLDQSVRDAVHRGAVD
ncbi:MAG: NAD(P)H-binding protein [Novosphingobium sp.]